MKIMETLLGTRSSAEKTTATEQVVILNRGFWEGFQAGTIVRLINISPETPIPQDWLERISPYDGPLPSDVPTMDCREAAAVAAAWNPPPRQETVRMLSSEELQKKLPILKNNPANYSLVTTQFGFPKPGKADVGTSVQDGRVVRERADCWLESEVDKWIEQMRERAAQYRALGF